MRLKYILVVKASCRNVSEVWDNVFGRQWHCSEELVFFIQIYFLKVIKKIFIVIIYNLHIYNDFLE